MVPVNHKLLKLLSKMMCHAHFAVKFTINSFNLIQYLLVAFQLTLPNRNLFCFRSYVVVQGQEP